MSDSAAVGNLRDRKRANAMRLVQEVAFDLFDAHGYGAITVERIAQASEVSASSIYRYFGTKENLVLWDETDPIWSTDATSSLRENPPPDSLRFMIDALIADVMRGDPHQMRRRLTFIMKEPSIEAASALQAYRAAETFGASVAAALGRTHGDLQVQLFSHGVVGAIVGAMHHWYESGFATPLETIMERVATSFEHGFGLTDEAPAQWSR